MKPYPLTVERTLHERGPGFTEATIARMGRFIREDSIKPAVRVAVMTELRRRSVPAHDFLAEARALYDWADDVITYRLDPARAEWVQSFQRTLEWGFGDCDDFAVFIGTAAEASGKPARLVTVAWEPDGPDRHVYPIVMVRGDWIPLDAIRSDRVPFGKHPPGAARRTIWELDGKRLSVEKGTMIDGFDGFVASLRDWRRDPDYVPDEGTRPRGEEGWQRFLFERRRVHKVVDPAAAAIFPKWAEAAKRVKSTATETYPEAAERISPAEPEPVDGFGALAELGRRRRSRAERQAARAARRRARLAARAARQAQRQAAHAARQGQRQEARRLRQEARQAARQQRVEERIAARAERQAARLERRAPAPAEDMPPEDVMPAEPMDETMPPSEMMPDQPEPAAPGDEVPMAPPSPVPPPASSPASFAPPPPADPGVAPDEPVFEDEPADADEPIDEAPEAAPAEPVEADDLIDEDTSDEPEPADADEPIEGFDEDDDDDDEAYDIDGDDDDDDGIEDDDDEAWEAFDGWLGAVERAGAPVEPPHDLPSDLEPAWWELNEAWSRAIVNWRDAGMPHSDDARVGELALRSSRLMSTTPANTGERAAWVTEQNALVAAWEVVEIGNAGAAAAAIKERSAARAAIEEAKPKEPKSAFEQLISFAPWVIGAALLLKFF